MRETDSRFEGTKGVMRTNYIRALTLFAVALAAWLLLTAVWEDPAEAKKRKRGAWIVFASDRTTGAGVNNPQGDLEIFRMNPDGTRLKQLTFNAVDDKQPVLSPSGRKIAYSSLDTPDSPSDTSFDEEIYVINSDGSREPDNLTDSSADDASNSHDSSPDWSPNGTKIAYANSKSGQSLEIFDMNADGSDPVNLTNNPNADFRPDYSPDGTKIAFTHFGSEQDIEIYDMNASDGSNPRNLTNNSDPNCATLQICINDFRPKYSPDSKQIIYDTVGKTGLNPEGDFEVYSMRADGAANTIDNLTNNNTDDLHPDYSPSGTKIVYTKLLSNSSGTVFNSPNSNPGELFTMNADGSGTPKPLTNTGNAFINQSPDWGRKPR